MIETILGRLRNLFSTGRITRRREKIIQGTTEFGRSIEGLEAHPYGFASRATKGAVLFLFKGGDVRAPLMLYTVDQESVPPLQDGETAVWNNFGSTVILRKTGKIELSGTSEGGIVLAKELKAQLDKNNEILQAILNIINTTIITEPGSGSPSALQAALKIALTGKTVGVFSNIESETVFHGNG